MSTVTIYGLVGKTIVYADPDALLIVTWDQPTGTYEVLTVLESVDLKVTETFTSHVAAFSDTARQVAEQWLEQNEYLPEKTRWLASWNQPGYLPDSDTLPAEFASYRDAVQFLIDEATRFAEEDADAVLEGVEISYVEKWATVLFRLKNALTRVETSPHGINPINEEPLTIYTGDHSMVFTLERVQ